MGYLAAASGALVGIAVVVYIVSILGLWKMFQKAGENAAFVKALIPIVNEYFLFKIAWNKSKFWLLLILEIVLGVCTGVSSATGAATLLGAGAGMAGSTLVLGIIQLIIGIITLVIGIRLYIKTSKAFGHGVGVGILLLFFSWIVMLVLGFGKSQYMGPQE